MVEKRHSRIPLSYFKQMAIVNDFSRATFEPYIYTVLYEHAKTAKTV